jgi:EmrB/QacA subfamily drug resistance transporter
VREGCELTTVDYSRKWQVMAAVGTGVFLSTVDGSIVNVALPTLERHFGANFAVVQWVVLAYLLTVSTLMLGIGRLADMFGKKPLYTIGYVIFTAGSVLAGLSPAIFWLILFRVLQAIGAAMILALGMAIITEAFPASERGRALGVTGAVTSVGIVLGPSLGGILIDALSWRWIFFVNLPVGILGTWLASRYVAHTRPPGRQRFDSWGALTMLVGLLALLLGLTLGQRLGFGDSRVLFIFAVSALLTAAFVFIERRAPQPMIDVSLFKNALLSVGLATGFASFVAIAGTVLLMPFYLQNVLGYEARQVGFLLAIVPISLGITAPISGALSDRFGTRPITVLGLAILLLGYYTLSTLDLHTTAAGYVLRFLPIGIGMGVFQSPNNSAVMGAAPRGRLGIVSGMLAVTRTLGQTTGVALLGAVWATRVFRHAGQTLPGGATWASPAAQVAGLHDTFAFIMIVIGTALAMAVWALVRARRQAVRPAAGSARQRSGRA